MSLSERIAQTAESKEKILLTGNEELDRRIGGFPLPTLALIEGENSSGKSVIVQQITYGALKHNFKVDYVTTENTIISLIRQMKSLFSEEIEDKFLSGELKVIVLHVKDLKWDEKISRYFLKVLENLINRSPAQIFVIDSLTYLVTHVSENEVLNFFTKCRNIVDSTEKSIFLTLHSFAFPSELMMRIRSICDCNIKLEIKEIGNMTVRLIIVTKLKGATKSTGNILTFEVDPSLGIKILPFSRAKA